MKHLFGSIIKLFTKAVTIGGSQVSVGTIATTAIVTVSLVGGTTYVATNHFNAATTDNTVVSEDVMLDDTTNVLDENVYSEATPNEETYVYSEDGSLQIPTTINDENGNEYNLNEEDIHIHSLERTVELEATCISEGYGTEYCTECDYSAEYTIPATNSHLISWTVVLEATEIADGLKDGYCVVCGEKVASEIIPIIPHEHNYIVESSSSPSCTEEGSNKLVCSICGSYETETVPAKGHSYSGNILHDSTCKEEGYIYQECSDCNDKKIVASVARKDHAYGDLQVETEPTCTEAGKSYQICKNCEFKKYTATDALGHNYGENEPVSENPATCTEEGSRTIHCDRCNEDIEETIPALGHNHQKDEVNSVPVTCTTDGKDVFVCSNEGCNDTYEVTIPTPGHTWGEWTETLAPTCLDDGSEKRECSACDEIEDRIIPALGHDLSVFVKIKKNPDCGFVNVYRCSHEGCEETTEIAGVGFLHDFNTEYTVDVEPTCTTEGSKSIHCKDCNAIKDGSVVTIAMIPHNPEDEYRVTEATCTTTGEKYKYCTECGTKVESIEIPLLPHSYGDWNITLNPTCTESGEKERECSCGHKDIVSIDALGHTFGNWIVTPPTCESSGLKVRVCSVCNASEEDENYKNENPQLNHIPTDWIIDEDATCLEEGSKHKECALCETLLETGIINALGHSFTNYVVEVPATDLAVGSETAKCDRCDVTDTREIAKLPHTHDYNVEIERIPATCTEDGSYTLKCRCGGTHVVVIPKTGHNYVVTDHADASCTLNGYSKYECSNEGCEDTYTETHSAFGHTSGDWEVIKEATDLEAGEKIRKCSVCSHVLETQEISKLPHTCDFNSLVEEQAPTCTTEGFKLYQCRCSLTNKEVVPATNHANADWITEKEATYTEMGLKKKVCPDCTAVLEQENIPVIPHECSYSVKSSTNPTCTTEGLTVESCDTCGATKTTSTPATGHTESDWIVDTAATCTSNGERHTTCTTCGTTISTETLNATGHAEGDWIIDSNATCTSNGQKHTACTTCGATISTETIAATGHSMSGWNTTSEASCESDGTETNSCGCGYSETRSIPATGHNYGDWIEDEEATEENPGSKHKECSNCGDIITEDIPQLPPHEHSYSETGRTEATCTSAGSITYSCECGDSYNTEIAQLSHNPGDWETETPATEDSTGLDVKKCTSCGNTVETKVTDKLEHVHNYTTESQEATCTEDGYEKQTCACGNVVNKVIPATGHSFGAATVIDATCTEDGSSTVACTKCGHSTETVIPATGHNYVQSKITHATCEAEGSIEKTCSNCNDIQTETIAVLAHEYAVTSTVEATCTAGGYEIETCKHCGNTNTINQTDALGHDEGTWTETVAPKLGVDGKKELHCNRCNTLLEEDKVDMLLTDGVDSVYTVNSPDGYVQVIGHYGTDAEVQKMHELVNELRVENGKQPFTYNEKMANSTLGAKNRAVTTANYWEHWCYEFSENIAYTPVFYSDYDDMEMVQKVFDSWVASEGHKNNMLNAGAQKLETAISVFYKKVEVAENHYLYERYWVQVFR